MSGAKPSLADERDDADVVHVLQRCDPVEPVLRPEGLRDPGADAEQERVSDQPDDETAHGQCRK